ncbi:PREDICTED: putative F-box protein At1g76830 [Camelina sativa]|uniref:F-box protein At1g76830 n=1 Tax=Camelina sativa TaxID=90675 RepID=A0ABM0SV59_CAMSA|nr:PREDICTED: putative F-box protein At1g76830 [Camelina sativa]
MEGTSFESSLARKIETRHQVLLATNDYDVRTPNRCRGLLHIINQEEEPLLSSVQKQISFTVALNGFFIASPPVRGLICFYEVKEDKYYRFSIYNQATKTCRALASTQADETTLMETHFGYDEIKDEFKVLCIKSNLENLWNVITYEVLTVGRPSEESWRRIECKVPHTSVSHHGVFDDRGTLYYLAHCKYDDTHTKNDIMSFNVSSEEFKPIPSPDGVDLINIGNWRLVNYKKKIVLVDDENGFVYKPNGDVYVEIWPVFEERRRILIRNWRDYARGPANELRYYDRFRGTTRTGELVFSPTKVTTEGSVTVIFYNMSTQTLRRSVVQLLGRGNENRFVDTFLDYVHNPLPV